MTNCHLFGGGSLAGFLENRKTQCKNELERMESDYVLNISEEDLCNYLISNYSLETPQIIEDGIRQDFKETIVDVSNDVKRITPKKPYYVKGTAVMIFIPFIGEVDLFLLRPSTFSSGHLVGDIKDNEILLTFGTADYDEEGKQRLKREIEQCMKDLKMYVGYVARDVENYNKNLDSFVREIVTKRRKKLLEERDLVAFLEIPIKRREDTAKSYTIPTVRKKPIIERPKMETEKPFEPEPALDMAMYENILSIAQNMTQVMECSPHSFATMKEEDIRQHFLVQLNAQYKGEGVAEAFNYEGKTDILMRHKGKNVFIAECKFWKGPKTLTDAIDQLLSYISWRDTKTAIFLFNRRKNFTAVLEKIPDVTREHPCYKQDIESNEETVFRYRFHHRDDVNRELWLTVMAFDVPKERE